jgi:hypothetical protein
MRLVARKFVTPKVLWTQLCRDLIGKDSQRGVTLTYAWLANQFGHFSLGFIPTFIVYLFIAKPESRQVSAQLAALYVGGFWVAFETYNLLGPLLLKRRFKSIASPFRKIVFKPDWRNLLYDTITDLGFFLVGACTAGIILASSQLLWIILISITVFLVVASYYWYGTKIYIQEAHFPVQFRISQFEQEVHKENIEKINAFRSNSAKSPQGDQAGYHLFMYGPANSGKSSLSVGMATELSIHHQSCLYATAMILFRLFCEKDDENSNRLWTWRNTGLLVIDDVNVGRPVRPEVISPDSFFNYLVNNNNKEENIKALRSRNVVWVLGDEDPVMVLEEDQVKAICKEENYIYNSSATMTWAHILRYIGVPDEKVSVVNLAKLPDKVSSRAARKASRKISPKEEYSYR